MEQQNISKEKSLRYTQIIFQTTKYQLNIKYILKYRTEEFIKEYSGSLKVVVTK